MTSTRRPTVTNYKRHAGIAGNYSVTVDVTYPGEDTAQLTFVASVYGGPVVMITSAGTQTFVSEATRDKCGTEVTQTWVRRFFGMCEDLTSDNHSDDLVERWHGADRPMMICGYHASRRW